MPGSDHASLSEAELMLSERQVEIIRQSQVYIESTLHPSSPSQPPSSSPRGASRASSQSLLHLDTSSMTLLSQHFDRILAHVQTQMGQLELQIQNSTMAQYDNSMMDISDADAEIQRYQGYIARMDELDNYFDEIASLRDIIKGNRQRIALLNDQLSNMPKATKSRKKNKRQKGPELSPQHESSASASK